MIAAVAIAVIGCFLVAFHLLRIVPVARAALGQTRGALAALRDPAADDLMREAAARRAASRLFGATLQIFLRGTVALVLALAPALVASLAGAVSLPDIFGFLSRLDVLIVTSVTIVIAWIVAARAWPAR